jgi:hypothetical protein
MKTKFRHLIEKPFLLSYSTVLGTWLLLPFIAWIMKYFPQKYNNFLIYKNIFINTVDQSNLYIPYPDRYFDVNLYGPIFSLVMAPFAITPLWFGLLSWLLISSILLYFATYHLQVSKKKKIFIYWFCAHELLTALFMSQFNVIVAAFIIFSFILIEKEKDFWAACLIMLGTFIKIYGIVGLAFFFFSKHKKVLLFSCILWSFLFFVIPMFYSSYDFIVDQYIEWYNSLTSKNLKNTFSLMQNISLLGMIRKISCNEVYSDIYIIIGGLALFFAPYMRISQYKNLGFRLTLLASVLLFIVLFSTGSESSTYIIAFMGVAIWAIAAPWKRSNLDYVLLVFALLLTSFSPSDLFPQYIRETFVRPYALKALPCVIIWFKLIYEMCTKEYAKTSYVFNE